MNQITVVRIHEGQPYQQTIEHWNRIVEEIDSVVAAEARKIEQRMLESVTQRLIAAGHTPAEAHELAVKALYQPVVPTSFVLPSFDDL